MTMFALLDPGLVSPASIVVRTKSLARRGSAYFRGAPVTLIYTFTLLVTWWTLRGASDRVTHGMIVSASTNLHNMKTEPMQVLVASAFWMDPSGNPLAMLLELLVVMVAAERWLGTWKTVVIFAIGHVGATVVTVAGIAYAVDRGLMSAHITHVADVGYSYGLMALAGALAFRFAGVWRAGWLLVLSGYLGFEVLVSHTFTDVGHLVALGLGVVAFGIVAGVRKVWRSRSVQRYAPQTPTQIGEPERTLRSGCANCVGSVGVNPMGSAFECKPMPLREHRRHPTVVEIGHSAAV